MSYLSRFKGGYSLYIFILSAVNLLYMHYWFFINEYMEVPLFFISPIINICSIIFDISILFVIFKGLLLNKTIYAINLCYFISLIWSFCNTFYGRFFFQYIPLSAFGMTGNLFEGIVVNSMLSGFQWQDTYYILSLLTFLYISAKYKSSDSIAYYIIYMPPITLLAIFFSYAIYHLASPTTRGNTELFWERTEGFIVGGDMKTSINPNLSRFHLGCVRYLCSQAYCNLFPKELSSKERQLIKNEYSNHKLKTSNYTCNNNIKNVVYIILESFLSVSSDMKVNGKEITPFLNSLKHSKDVYYNGHVSPNITIGESGDGQFIYMTGILPCRNEYVLGFAQNNEFPALPRILKKYKGIEYSEIIIPTVPKVWSQDKMNKVYGIKRLYSYFDKYGTKKNNINLCLNDEEIFDMAINTPKSHNKPFFQIILSSSTHMPYNDIVDNSFKLYDQSLPKSYLIYLNACHYTDSQIKRYFDYLKHNNLFENTIIIIMADHNAHLMSLNMENKISEELPLYIINGGFNPIKAYKGHCNQLDVYTTLLDILGIESEWLGLGNTLLSPNYKNSVSTKVYEISELIVKGNYFK